MVQIIPAAAPKRTFGSKLNEGIGRGLELAEKYVNRNSENEALKSRGIDVNGITDPETRAQLIAHDLKYGAKKAQANALREPGYGEQREEEKKGSGIVGEGTYKKESLPGFMGREEIEPKRGLYSQKTTQGELQPIRSAQQVQQDGIARARRVSDSGFIMSDQEGIDYENAVNNQVMQSNQRIQGEHQALQQEKSIMNRKGQDQALNTIGQDNLTPEVAAYFGKQAENIASEVNTESDLDKRLADEIKNYKKTVAIASNSVNEPPQNLMGDDSLGEKVINDLRKKVDPLLKMGLYDKVRDILSQKGYGPEQRETVVSNLPDTVNKVLSGIPNFRTKQKLGHPRQGAQILRDYSDDEKEVINNSMSQIFKADPSTNIVLLRKRMRDEKNIDWRAFKDGLDYAIDTGTLPLTEENLDQYSRMSEPEETGLQQLLRVFGVGGR